MTSAAVRACSPVRATCACSFSRWRGSGPAGCRRTLSIDPDKERSLSLARWFRSTGAAIAGKSITERLCVFRLDLNRTPRDRARREPGICGVLRKNTDMSRRKRSSTPPDPPVINPISIKQALAVAEHLSFRAAARALGVRHSAVSRRVRALEEKLGVTLFERHLRGVTLTNAGVRFFQQAREGFAHLDCASRTAARAGRGEMGQLRIGILSSMGAGFLRDLIQSFSARHPDVAIRIHEGGSADHISLVRRRQLDIAFVMPAS
jgi:DNA-binding transcriptional ArsR family regulator